jgi:hypothetical protein
MPDLSAIAAALSSFKTMKDIAQAMIGLRDAQAFQAKLIEFNSALIDAQTNVFSVNEERSALIERVRDLEAKIAEIEGWEAEKKRYELKEVAPRVFTYVLKPEAQGSEPSHWICPGCYQKRQKSILQGLESHSFGWSHSCPSCNLEIRA